METRWANLEPRVLELDKELGWGLSPQKTSFYASSIIQYAPERLNDAQLRMLILNFHNDHALVASLRENDADSWATQLQWIRSIVAKQVRFYTGDELSLDDGMQIAAEELFRSLEQYRYASRFSTWAYTVALRAIQRYLRSHLANKRAGKVESLDVPDGMIAEPVSIIDQPEALAGAKELAGIIDSILSQDSDSRLAQIFMLRFHNDMRLADIGEHMGLSASRVSVLLDQARNMLRNHPAIREWVTRQDEEI